MNADKNKQDGSFPEADEVYKAAAPRQSAARKRVSPRPEWLAERPEVRVRKDLAAFFEFFTPLHVCIAHPHRCGVCCIDWGAATMASGPPRFLKRISNHMNSRIKYLVVTTSTCV